jgi:TP901 family phage tail tape measure protein
MAGAALAVVGESLKMAGGFQAATTQLVTGAGESEKSLEMVRRGLLKMAPAVAMGPEALAKGMFMVESAGFHGAAGLNVMKAAAEGAKIGAADVSAVSDALTTSLKDYRLPASKAAEVTSQLVATVARGKTHMEDLAGSLGHVLPFASALKIKFSDIMGAMATMTARGIDADTAATYLKFTIMSLAHETPKGSKALEGIGLSASIVGDSLSKKGLSGTLEMITDALGKKFPVGSAKYIAALADIVGGTRGMGAALALTGGNMGDYKKNIDAISGATVEAGGHVKGWQKTQEDFNVKLDETRAKIETTAIKLGTALFPAVQKVVGAFGDFGTWVGDHVGIFLTLIGIIGGIGGVLIAVSTAMKIAAAAQWILNAAMGANPIGAVILALVALVGIYSWVAANWDGLVSRQRTTIFEVVKWINWLGGQIYGALSGAIRSVEGFFGGLWNGIVRGSQGAANGVVSAFFGMQRNILGFFAGIGGWLVGVGRSLIQGLINGVTGMAGQLGGIVRNLATNAVNVIKGALGIHSPSTVTFWHGKMFVQGLVNGILSGKRSIDRAVQAVMPTLSPSQATTLGQQSPSAGAGAPGSSGGLYINKFVAGSASAAQIASELGWLGRWAT